MPEPQPAPNRLAYADFLAQADEDVPAEWVDGEVVYLSPASRRHQHIADFLTAVLRAYVEERELGVVLSAPFQMKLENGREPDVLFVKTGNLDRLHETFLQGPADLAVEVVSPESVGRDRGEKLYEYARGGVPEYWVVDPQRAWFEAYRLEGTSGEASGPEGARYRPAFSSDEGRYESAAVEGFWLDVDWLWQDPPPRLLDVLAAYQLR